MEEDRGAMLRKLWNVECRMCGCFDMIARIRLRENYEVTCSERLTCAEPAEVLC